MTEILKVLYKLPIGAPLWSPVCGACIFEGINEKERMCIHVSSDGHIFKFGKNGEGMRSDKCLLFPSEKHQSWTGYNPKIEETPTVEQFGENVVIEQPKRTLAIGTPVFCSNEICPDMILHWQLCVYKGNHKAQTQTFPKPIFFEYIVAFSDFDPIDLLNNVELSI